MPIGNLSSQFFANIYLNELDQVVHKMKGRGDALYFQRYMDDTLIVGRDPEKLRAIIPELASFLAQNLALEFNHSKTLLHPIHPTS